MLGMVVWVRLQRTIQGRIEQLTAQLEEAGAEVAEMQRLREAVHEAAEKFRFEKEARTRAFDDVKAANEKVCGVSSCSWPSVLSPFLWVSHLKHEASAKVKAYNVARSFDGELEALRNKNAILAKRNATRERVITEMKVCALFSVNGVHVTY
jgi:hypothetical protein